MKKSELKVANERLTAALQEMSDLKTLMEKRMEEAIELARFRQEIIDSVRRSNQDLMDLIETLKGRNKADSQRAIQSNAVLNAQIEKFVERIKSLEEESRNVPLCADHAATWFCARHFKPGDCWFCQQDVLIKALADRLRECNGVIKLLCRGKTSGMILVCAQVLQKNDQAIASTSTEVTMTHV